MPEFAPITPAPRAPQAPQQSPSSGQASAGSESGFGSLLQDTLPAKQKLENQPAANKADQRATARGQQHLAPGDPDQSRPTDPTTDLAADGSDGQQPATPIAPGLQTRAANLLNQLGLLSPGQESGTSFEPGLAAQSLNSAGTAKGSAVALFDISQLPFSATGDAELNPALLLNAKDFPGKLTDTASQNSLLARQLSQLIQANDRGTVTISSQPNPELASEGLRSLASPVLPGEGTGPRPSPVSESLATLLPTTGQTPPVTPTRVVTEPQLPSQQLQQGNVPSIRAEITTQSAQNDPTGEQNGNNGSTSPGTQPNLQLGLAATGETGSTFAQVQHGVSELASLQQSAQTQPTTSTTTSQLPVPPQVSEQSVLNQVVERFQLQTRLQDTHINIKLHPAELGELKIDLTYREGAIKAHVYAQSHYAQEILEKNLPRLRSLLEAQGLTIDQLLVSAKEDAVGDFDLLQQEFARNGGDNKQQQFANDRGAASFLDSLEQARNQSLETAAGVNLTV